MKDRRLAIERFVVQNILIISEFRLNLPQTEYVLRKGSKEAKKEKRLMNEIQRRLENMTA